MKEIDATFTFLGTGGSMGVPVVGCHCSVCLSTNSFNKRLRSSALITFDEKNILIDCGPDFRAQALTEKLSFLDGLIITHGHYDHIGGIDDLRALFISQNKPILTLLSKETYQEIKMRFDYIFQKEKKKVQLMPEIILKELQKECGIETFLGLKIGYFSFFQKNMKVMGLKLGNLAYISDIKQYDEELFDQLKGVETLIISALRFTPSPMHFSVDDAIEFSKRVNPKRTFLTHTAHELDYEKTNSYLPTNIQMGYDGLKLNFQVEVE